MKKLDAIDYGYQMPEIDVLGSIKKIDIAWKNISAETIKNCFRKAGFKIDEQPDVVISEENNEIIEEKRLQAMCSRLDLDYSSIVNIDCDLLSSETLSDKQIIDYITNKNEEVEVSENIEEVNDKEINIINHREALNSLNTLKDFYMCSNKDSNEIISFLMKLENDILTSRNTKQTEINDFFTKQC